jgi:hypothetical protein
MVGRGVGAPAGRSGGARREGNGLRGNSGRLLTIAMSPAAAPPCRRAVVSPSWEKRPADMARLVRTFRVRRGTPCRKRRGSDLGRFGRLRRAWSVRCTCGAARHVSKLNVRRNMRTQNSVRTSGNGCPAPGKKNSAFRGVGGYAPPARAEIDVRRSDRRERALRAHTRTSL